MSHMDEIREAKTKGTCEKHGEFILSEGCLGCLAERQAADITLSNAEETERAETALALRPGEDIEARGYYLESVKLFKYAEARVIATVEDDKLANDDLVIIGNLKRVMDNKRKSLLEPLELQKVAIRDTYNFLMTPVIEADRITRGKSTAFKLEQKRKAHEAEELNRQAIEIAQKQAAMHNGVFTTDITPVEVPPAPKVTRSALGTSGLVDCWKWEVTDFALLPDEYKVVDGAMLTTIAKRHHDQKQIPGVKFYNEPTMATRAR